MGMRPSAAAQAHLRTQTCIHTQLVQYNRPCYRDCTLVTTCMDYSTIVAIQMLVVIVGIQS